MLKAIYAARDLTPTEKAVLAYMAFRADLRLLAWPSLATICADSGYSKQTVVTALQSLVAKKWLHVTGLSPGGRGKTTVYRVVVEGDRSDGSTANSPTSRQIETVYSRDGNCPTGIAETVNQLDGKGEKLSNPAVAIKEELSKEPPIKHSSAEAREQEFKAYTREQAKLERQFMEFKAYLQRVVLPHSYETWLRPVRVRGVAQGVMTLQVPAREFFMIGDKYSAVMTDACTHAGLDVQRFRLVTA